MGLKQLQEQVAKVMADNAKRDGFVVNDDYLVLKATEELGEFVQSYLIHKRKCRPVKHLSEQESKREVSKELADVLGLVLVIAESLNIDVEEALVKKWITREWIKQ